MSRNNRKKLMRADGGMYPPEAAKAGETIVGSGIGGDFARYLAEHAGLGAADVCSLRWADFGFESGVLNIPGIGSVKTEETVRIIREQYARYVRRFGRAPKQGDCIVPDKGAGAPREAEAERGAQSGNRL